MKCPNCGNELEEGKLLCEKCGEEIKIVPDFDIELEAKLKESLSSVLEDIAVQEEAKGNVFGESEHDDDIENASSGIFSGKSAKIHRIKITGIVLAIVLACILASAGIAAIVRYNVSNYRNNSYEYQYNMAVECAAYNNYSEAVNYLERALEINSEDMDARFLLAKYYDESGQQQSAISLLEEILEMESDYSKRDEVYDMLLGLYESRFDYLKMSETLMTCDVSRIVTKYNRYRALKPEFNIQGGVYDNLISITLTGNTQGVIYYTLDGTVPTRSSPVYETPILLESGDYIIRAIFVNMYGVESDIETQHYYISLSAPDSPVVNPESGSYTEPCLIEVFHDNNTRIYYTTDGSVPGKNSSRYMDSLEMPYGISNFSFIAINESGLRSEVVSRTYHLETQANFDAELALQVLVNNLCASGKLLDAEGNLPNKLGFNQYRVQTLYKTEGSIYYIVYEEYVDTMGKEHDTSNIYAIDADTADLYTAYKIDEGKYNLMPFAE